MTLTAASAPIATVAPKARRAKTAATWIALLGGCLGLHRMYLNGWRDRWAWLHLPPTLIGAYGLQRALTLGQDDHLSWLLVPLLGLMVAQGALMAIVYGLTPDEKWDAQHNPGRPVKAAGWGPVLGAMLGLAIGAGVLMATIAFSGQRYFEYQVEEGHKLSE
jgi:hypothetical protein